MSRSITIGLLAVILIVPYANHFQNSFHFDDAHTIVNNAAIQSLRNIPRFFTHATTFSALPSNQSYRPLLSTLFAIDYQLSAKAARTSALNSSWTHLAILAPFAAPVLRPALAVAQVIANVWL